MVCGSTAPLAADWWAVGLDLTFKSIMARNGRWKKCSCITIMIEKAVGVRSSNRRLAFVCWRSPRLYSLLGDKNDFFFQLLHQASSQSYTKLLKHQISPCCVKQQKGTIRRMFVLQKRHKRFFVHNLWLHTTILFTNKKAERVMRCYVFYAAFKLTN